MTRSLHDTGEEHFMDVLFGGSSNVSSVNVSLYNDSTDALSDTSDVGDITTEPAGASFARQSASIGTNFTVSDNSGDWEAIIDDLTFDTSDSSQTVDSYFVVVNFQADDTSDTSATDHLYWTGALSSSTDLSSVDTFNLTGAGISVT